MRKVIVCDYDQNWKRQFQAAAAEIQEVFGKECLAIHHIGSTAVAGLAAKPIIDLMPVVKDIELVDQFNTKMKQLGYESKGENGLPGRRYFQKGGDERTHHVHVYETGNSEIKRHLVFREYLKKHSIEAEKYGTLKKELAKKHPMDIESYIQGKEQLVKEIEKRAMEDF